MRRLPFTLSWPMYSSSRRGRRLLSRETSSSLTSAETILSATALLLLKNWCSTFHLSLYQKIDEAQSPTSPSSCHAVHFPVSCLPRRKKYHHRRRKSRKTDMGKIIFGMTMSLDGF